MNPKLLIVDDDSTLLRFMTEYFQDAPFHVLTASNGQDALRLAYREHPDLVVLDVMMPGMDGWEVTARLKELSDIPIILLTGKTAEEDKLHGFNLGVDDYITKPFSFAELNARILAVLNRARNNQTSFNIIPIGNLLLDLNRHEVRSNNEIIPLTPTEFRLLEVLAQNHGKAISESELVGSVWGQGRLEETATVRRYIWLLRQKIEPDPSKPQYVLTVRGFGYRLES